MRSVKVIVLAVIWLVFAASVILAHGAALALGPAWRWKTISRLMRSFNRVIARLLNLKVEVEGSLDAPAETGCLIVSNHVGYIDGIVLAGLFPIIFVTKSEVRRWPLIGQWTALVGTIYVERNRKNKIPLFVEETAGKLKLGVNVLIFPEGTSTDGEKILPFQSAHFAGPLKAGAPILPVTIRYRTVDGEPISGRNRDRVYWYGDMEFTPHFWGLLGLRSLEVSVKIHPKLEAASYRNNSASRKQVSQACHAIITGEKAGLNKMERGSPAAQGRGRTREPGEKSGVSQW
jgi:1-acyl-sn-glycerol-3-phosphate acyltransferase